MVYRQFQNEQYYFYLNHGYTKTELMTKVFAINLSIALALTIATGNVIVLTVTKMNL